jgi:hypothetical protein
MLLPLLLQTELQRIFTSKLNTLMGAPLRFFTTTDTGITTNRFAQDMLLQDLDITYGIIVIAEITGTVGQAIVIAVTSPYIAMSYPIPGGLRHCVQRFLLEDIKTTEISRSGIKESTVASRTQFPDTLTDDESTHFLETLQDSSGIWHDTAAS